MPSDRDRRAYRAAQERLSAGYGWPVEAPRRFLGLSFRGWSLLTIGALDVLVIGGIVGLVAALLGWRP